MDKLLVGFGRVNITPAMGTPIAGYYNVRLANKVLDELEASAVAFACGDTKALLLSVDIAGIYEKVVTPMRHEISRVTGVPFEAIFVACTHTHTGADINKNILPDVQKVYEEFLTRRLCDAAMFALADLKPARMGWGVGQAPNISFVRRFRMKDGSSRTNPGVGNPDIVAPIGDVDERVGVVRFEREGGETIVLANFGTHPDVVGGCNISADWPGFARRTVEKAIDNTRCVLLNGAQGDVNHINVAPIPGMLNDLENDFDDVMRGYGHARFMGRTVAGAVLQVYDKVNYVEVNSLTAMQQVIHCPSNMPKPEELPLARRYNELHKAGRDEEIPFEGMMLTTVVAEAERMLDLEHGPESFALPMTVLAVGDVALVGIPGEPFTAIGRAIKQAEGWQLVMPCCITNGYEGYFPTMEAYLEGGYEARSSIFKAGIAEAVSGAGLEMLDTIRKNKGGC